MNSNKRIAVSPEAYDSAVKIGLNITGNMSSKAASAGVEVALKHYIETKDINHSLHAKLIRLKNIDESVANTLSAIYMLAENAKMPHNEIEDKINSVLKVLIPEIMGI